MTVGNNLNINKKLWPRIEAIKRTEILDPTSNYIFSTKYALITYLLTQTGLIANVLYL